MDPLVGGFPVHAVTALKEPEASNWRNNITEVHENSFPAPVVFAEWLVKEPYLVEEVTVLYDPSSLGTSILNQPVDDAEKGSVCCRNEMIRLLRYFYDIVSIEVCPTQAVVYLHIRAAERLEVGPWWVFYVHDAFVRECLQVRSRFQVRFRLGVEVDGLLICFRKSEARYHNL